MTLRTGILPFGSGVLDFLLCTPQALRPCDPRTDASDHVLVLAIFDLLVVVAVLLHLLLLLLLLLLLELPVVLFVVLAKLYYTS